MEEDEAGHPFWHMTALVESLKSIFRIRLARYRLRVGQVDVIQGNIQRPRRGDGLFIHWAKERGP
jgi:hypothetical protein